MADLGSRSGGDLDPANPPRPDSSPRRISSARSDPQLPPLEDGGLPTVNDVLKKNKGRESVFKVQSAGHLLKRGGT